MNLNYLKRKIKYMLLKPWRIKSQGNNNVINIGYSLVNSSIRIIGCNNKILFDKNVLFENVNIELAGNNLLLIVGSNSRMSGGEIILEDDFSEVRIGKNTTVESAHIASTEGKSIEIGDNCMLANNVEIRNGDSHSILQNHSRINHAKNVIIDNNVWVGSQSFLLKGSEISTCSVVAAKSLVTKSFRESNLLIGGVPAQILKKNIYWKRERV